jgi:hypothetical protein
MTGGTFGLSRPDLTGMTPAAVTFDVPAAPYRHGGARPHGHPDKWLWEMDLL